MKGKYCHSKEDFLKAVKNTSKNKIIFWKNKEYIYNPKVKKFTVVDTHTGKIIGYIYNPVTKKYYPEMSYPKEEREIKGLWSNKNKKWWW